ncbi:hypothetical protein AMECASPLE_033908 [Ameca splendens]|uniref:Uncharacterized protein n=1 Tax=Ameca splendens TaxID=208324 RepID=A0ABV0XW64_9TELE
MMSLVLQAVEVPACCHCSSSPRIGVLVPAGSPLSPSQTATFGQDRPVFLGAPYSLIWRSRLCSSITSSAPRSQPCLGQVAQGSSAPGCSPCRRPHPPPQA